MPVVAIDGPVGAGKSTIARVVGVALGLPVLETGAMYRAVTWAAMRSGTVPVGDSAADPDPDSVEAEAEAAAAVARFALVARSIEIETGEHILVDGEDVTVVLRSPAVGQMVSAVAAIPAVRDAMVERQRAWVAERGGAVVEGRDIGTVVFPDADLKVFLTASASERARRRGGDESADDVARRDLLDSTRATSPLVAAADAVIIDTTGRDIDAIAAEIVARLRGEQFT